MNNQEATRLIRNLPTMCEFTDAYGKPIDSDAYYEAVNMAISALQAQPEIIHCKDCKHFGVDRYKNLTWCSKINYGYGYQADDFCSKAERRTDGSD